MFYSNVGKTSHWGKQVMPDDQMIDKQDQKQSRLKRVIMGTGSD